MRVLASQGTDHRNHHGDVAHGGETDDKQVVFLHRVLVGLMGFMGHWELLFLVENGVGGWVVVHLHLTIDFHVLATCLNVFQQLVDGQREVALPVFFFAITISL